MKVNKIEGKVLCCVVIPDYHKLYNLEWKWKHVYSRYHTLRNNPPLLKCFCKKAYLKDEAYEKAIDKIDYQIDDQLCGEVKASNLAFIVFDKISVAKKIKDLIT